MSDLENVDQKAQAALMEHFITERYVTEGYKANKEAIARDFGTGSTGTFINAHNAGIVTETAIISEQTGIQVQTAN